MEPRLSPQTNQSPWPRPKVWKPRFHSPPPLGGKNHATSYHLFNCLLGRPTESGVSIPYCFTKFLTIFYWINVSASSIRYPDPDSLVSWVLQLWVQSLGTGLCCQCDHKPRIIHEQTVHFCQTRERKGGRRVEWAWPSVRPSIWFNGHISLSPSVRVEI